MTAYAIAPVNVICQIFQISILTVFVSFNINMIILTKIATGIATVAILDAHVIGDIPGHPRSTTLMLNPKFLDICCAAGPRFAFIMSTISPNPTKPTPTIKPARTALPIFTPTIILKIAITSGSIADAPISMM